MLSIPKSLIVPFMVLLVGVSIVTGCGKSVQLGEKAAPDPLPVLPPTVTQPILKSCAEADRKHWSFVQPGPTETRRVDLLFVVDTSSSLEGERDQIAASIPSFVSKLKLGSDLRIAVMLAHGGASPLSGRLYSNFGAAKVIDALTLPINEVKTILGNNLRKVTKDEDEANGELLMYSLKRSLEPDRVAEIQAQGFYRPDAALSVVFVTDENDGCFSPKDHGFTTFPDYKPSVGGLEETAYKRYCGLPLEVTGDYYEWMDQALRAFKGKMPVHLGAITHVDPSKVPFTPTNEDSLGHGVIELIAKDPGGVLMDIADTSYDSGLEQLGDVVSQGQVNLFTHFQLSGGPLIWEASLLATVDAVKVSPKYNALDSSVDLLLSEAGRSGSQVDVSACLLGSKPSP